MSSTPSNMIDHAARLIRGGGLAFTKARAQVVYFSLVLMDPTGKGATIRELREATGFSEETIRAGVDDLVRQGRATMIQPMPGGIGSGRGRQPWRVIVHVRGFEV